jgi:amidase
VHIERVTASPPTGRGWTGVFAGFGALTHEAYSLQEPLDPVTTLVGYDADVARLELGGGRVAELPVSPFLGTVGVAPKRERRMSFSQSPEYHRSPVPDLSPGLTDHVVRAGTYVLFPM